MASDSPNQRVDLSDAARQLKEDVVKEHDEIGPEDVIVVHEEHADDEPCTLKAEVSDCATPSREGGSE